MRKVLFTFCCLLCIVSVQAQTSITINSGTDIINSGAMYNISGVYGPGVIPDSFINNGEYIDTTAIGAFNVAGPFYFSGAGITDVYDFNINSGLSTLAATVTVWDSATINTGDSLASSGFLVLHSGATLVNNGALMGNVVGLVTNASATSGACPSFTSALSLNVSGTEMKYQWQSSTDDATWTPVAGATNATYTATVTGTVYYSCSLTTANTSYAQATPGVELIYDYIAPTTGAITGASAVCTGATTALTDAAGGGVWSSSNTAAGTVSTGGIVYGVAAGVTTISYTVTTACGSLSATQVMTVNPTPNVATIPNQTLCNTAATTAVDFSSTVSGTTYSWTNSNTNIGLTGSGSGNNISSFTATNTTNATITGTITVTPSTSSCTGAAQSFNITVHPTPTVTSVTDQYYCNSLSTTAITFTGSVSGATYSWTNDNISIGTGASGTNSIPTFTTTNTTNSLNTGVIVVSPSANGCIGSPLGFSINVYPTATETIPSTEGICNGTATGNLNFNGTVAGTTYTWTNSNSSIGLASTGTNSIPSFTVINAGTTTETAVISVTPSANGCSGSVQSFTLYVHPTPTVNNPGNQTLCNNTTTSTIHFTGAVDFTEYSWTNSNTTIGLGASGVGHHIYSFTALNGSAVIDTAVINVTPTAHGCAGEAESFLIIADPTPSVTATSDQTVCNGVADSVSFSGSAVAGTAYVWTNSNSGIGLGASGAGTTYFTATSGTNVADTGTIIVTPTANSCNGTPDTFTISVNPTPTVATTHDTALCNGVSYAVTFTGSLVSGTTYAWTNSNTTIGIGASGTDTTGTFTATNGTNVIDTSIVTVTPWASGCNGVSDTFTIIVNPTPTVTVPATEGVCNGAATGDLDFSGPVSGTVYTWTNSNSSIGLASTGTNSILSFAAINTGTTTQEAVITVTPSANGCTGTAHSFHLWVHPTPTVGTPDNQTICNNATTTAVDFSGTVDFTHYSWTNSDTAIGLAASGTGNIALFTATNGTSVIDTAVITVTPTAHECVGPSTSFMIVVDPTPNVAPTPDETVCNGTTDSVSFGGTVLNTSFSWTNSNTGIGLGASGTGTTLFTATSGIHIADTGTIIVTPSANSCGGAPDTFTISVNPTPTVAPSDDTALCNGTVYSATFGGSLVANTTYAWTNSNTTIGMAASGTDTTGTFTATNITPNVVSGMVTVTPWASGCAGITDTFTITVNPTPMLSSALILPAQCDSTNVYYADTSLTAGTTYAWTMPSITNISVPATNGIDSINEIIVNSSTNPIAVTFVYTLTANACVHTQNVVVTINPNPQLSSPLTNAQCDSMVFAYVPTSLTGDSSFMWTRLYVEGTDSLGGIGTGGINDFLINTTSANVTDTYKYIITAYGCSDSELVTVTVHPTPKLLSTLTPNPICSGATFNYLPESLTGGVSYAWTEDSVANIGSSMTSGMDGVDNVLTNSSSVPLQVTYVYTLTANGCSFTQDVNLIVNPLPVAPVITTSVSDVCDNAMYQNFGVSTPPPAGESYTWSSTAGGSIAAIGNSGQYSIVDFSEPGTTTIMVTATINSTGCNSESSVPVTVGTGSATQAYVVYSFGEFICLENNVTSYQWGYDNKATLDSTILVGQINQNYANSNPDTIHNYYWVITTQNGCSAKSYYNTPGATAISNVNEGTTDVKVYPNPASALVNVDITSTETGDVTVELTDMLGQKINEVPASNNKAVIDVSKLAAGVYIIDCYCGGIKIAAAKFIKN